MFEKHIWKINLQIGPDSRILGLSPLLQSSLDNFCDSLPRDNTLVVGKYLKPRHQLDKIVAETGKVKDPIKNSYVRRVALYILWRAVLQQYVAPSAGMSRATYDLCKRCPPFGVNVSTCNNLIPFESKYTCKHYMCPSCRMRKILAAWNKFNDQIEFSPGVDLELIKFEVKRKFMFTGVGETDFKLNTLRDILNKFKSLLWTYGGTWSLGIESSVHEVTVKLKCGAVCPPMTKKKSRKVDQFVSGANMLSALVDNDMGVTAHRRKIKYDKIEVEKLFSEVLDTAVWPTSFMVDCTNPLSVLFAGELESQLRGEKTIGTFGPCSTVSKRLKDK
mgnify:FL=1|tara:strand:- start:950 stop:1945 length:996 start_codon:yes stop_codon:yes gene_type:complete